MSNKKHKEAAHEEHADESWLIPYADLLTLLLALFIVLFASSTIDQEKYDALKAALYEAFNGKIPESSVEVEIPDYIDWSPDDTSPGDDSSSGSDSGGGLDGLYESMKTYININGLENTVDVQYQGENVLITLKNDIWFEPGSAALTPEMREKAEVLAQILKDNENSESPFDIIVAGHTDNIPINTARYPSNLDLSLVRAAEFHRYLLKTSGLDPANFSSRGYGAEKPIASNDTPEGRARNRRVELLVSESIKTGES